MRRPDRLVFADADLEKRLSHTEGFVGSVEDGEMSSQKAGVQEINEVLRRLSRGLHRLC